jgi:predicted unusual protein kinase regulating ubiquinone biosynthesis (AarF/ABC1/UbiB family)
VVDLGSGRARREAHRTSRRARELERLTLALGELKGAFTKAGQFASLRVDLASEELRSALTRLRDSVPPLPLSQIGPLVEEELGAPIDRLFSRFEAEPLGAASIAQVHRAWLADGRPVAVKLQYPWIAASLPSDLRIAKRALRLATRLAGRDLPDLDRIVDEFGRSLADELDFRREAQIAAEIAQNLSADPQILVPEVIASHSSQRVLTMSYVETVGIADLPGLAELGVEPSAVLEILARAYAKQVFVDGLFHADPHPGNLFVVREDTAAERPRVLFVDFGLSKRLDPELRRELRRGIYALLQRDLDAFLAGMDALGMISPGHEPDVAAAVASMFERIAQSGGALGVGSQQVLSLKDEAKELLANTPGLQLPADLLLYAKTITYLFGLGEVLDPRVDLMKIALPYLLKFLAQKQPAEG